jgi:hypothetical protein
MINYEFHAEVKRPDRFWQRRSLVNLWREYGGDWVTIRKKA